MTPNDREFILKRLQVVQENLQAQVDALKKTLMSAEHGHALDQRIAAFDANVAFLRDATTHATDECARLSQLVQRLSCLQRDTDPAIPCALKVEGHRRSLHSSEELEDFSEVTSATLKAIMPAVVEAVRKNRSGFPIQFSTPGGWAVKLSAVGALIVGFAVVGWWLVKHVFGH